MSLPSGVSTGVGAVHINFRHMGTTASTRSAYHHLGERGRFLTTRDVFVKRYVEQESEKVLHQFYDEYVAECAKHVHEQLAYEPNEEFQLAFEVIDENPYERTRTIHSVSDKYLHDVLQYSCALVDDANHLPSEGRELMMSQSLGGSSSMGQSTARPWCQDGEHERLVAGKSSYYRGFFYFLWNSTVGEKYGRLEVKGSRMIAELMSCNVRVPLSYHVRYKGRAVTTVALCPLTRQTEVSDDETPLDGTLRTEWDILCMELAAALKLKGYEYKNLMQYKPPMVQRHNGLDGRRYCIANSFWIPRIPPPAPRRQSAQHYYVAMRPTALVNTRENITARSFHAMSMVHEDRAMIHAASQLVDVNIHQLAKEDTTNILSEFRKAGFNYSLLGVLLCSLLRNVSPPTNLVDSVIVEMMARGINDFICDTVCPLGDRQRMELARGGGLFDTSADFDTRFHATDLVGEAARFFGMAHEILREVLDYEGEPAPRAETADEPEILLPKSFYGGQVIPHIYRKFRLIIDDVDLFKEWNVPMRRAIYGRAVQLLGLRMEDGVIKDALPILCCRSAPSDPIAPWCRRRLRHLAHQLLLKPLAPRAHWERDGPGLILLLRLNPAYWQFYDKMFENVSRTELPYIDEHAIAVTPQLSQLEEYVDESWAEMKDMSNKDFDVQRAVSLMRLIRMVAAALHDVGRGRDAIHNLRRARRLCERVFDKGHSVLFSPQFRAVTQQLRDYLPAGDLSPLMEMLRLTLKHCPLDIVTAFDYITVGAAQLALGQREEALQNLARARHIAQQHVRDNDPRLIVMVANEADIQRQTGDWEMAANFIRPVVQHKTCPPAVLRLAADIFGAIGEPEAAFAATIRAEHLEETVIAMQAAVVYVASPTGGPPGTKVQVDMPRMGAASRTLVQRMKETLFGASKTDEMSTAEEDDDPNAPVSQFPPRRRRRRRRGGRGDGGPRGAGYGVQRSVRLQGVRRRGDGATR
jgi:tetratricopeptide (TPR) repeat protein